MFLDLQDGRSHLLPVRGSLRLPSCKSRNMNPPL